MRRPLLVIAVAGAAALGGAAAAQAQTAAPAGRMLSWPGKTERAQPAPVADAPEAVQHSTVAPPAVPPPFVAYAPGQAPRTVNNRYSPRSGAPRMASRAPVSALFAQPFVQPAPVYAPPATAAPAPNYGPPVIPNEVRPASRPVLAQPRPAPRAEPAPPSVEPNPPARAAAAPVRSSKSAKAAAKPDSTPAAAPVQTAAVPSGERAFVRPGAPVGGGERPFVRPATGNGPRLYSVHREFGQQPDAAQRAAPTGPAAERLPTGFFNAATAPAEEDEEVQDDAETRNAAIRAEVKRQVAAQPNRRR